MKLATQLWPSEQPVDPSREKILLLHGMGGTGALWRPIAAGLEDRFQVLAPDQRGHGRSQIPMTPGGRSNPEYTPLEYGKDVIETMDSLGFHPVWAVGHSMGVRTACAAAHLKPEWFKGLILIDLGFSGVAGGGLGEGLAQFVRHLPESFPSREDARKFMQAECPDPAIAQYMMAVSVVLPDKRQGFPFDRSALIKTIEAARDSSVRTWVKDLAERGIRILIMRGQNSSVWSHAEFVQEQQNFKGLPNVVFMEFQGAGHGLPFEQRPLFIQELTKFIVD